MSGVPLGVIFLLKGGHNQCFPPQVGCSVESQGCWSLVSSLVQGQHQPTGVECGFPSSSLFLARSGRSSCAHSVRQHFDGVSPEPLRWHKVPQVPASHSQDSHLVSSSTNITEGSSPPGVEQSGSRRPLTVISSL